MQTSNSEVEKQCRYVLKEAVFIGSILPSTAVIIFLSHLFVTGECLYRILFLFILPPAWPLYWAYWVSSYLSVAKEYHAWSFAADKILYFSPKTYVRAIKKDGYTILYETDHFIEFLDEEGKKKSIFL